MITPAYSSIKQDEFRDPIIEKMDVRYNEFNAYKMISLGGAHCLDNINSIERQWLKANKLNTLEVVDNDLTSVRQLCKKLKNVKKIRYPHITVYEGTFRGSNVIIVKAKLNTYLQFVAGKKSYDSMILDYYGVFGRAEERSIKLIARNNLLNRKGSIVLTSCELGRAVNTGAAKRVLRVNRDYTKGIQRIVKNTFSKRIIARDYWDYANTDVSKNALTMYVNDFQLA